MNILLEKEKHAPRYLPRLVLLHIRARLSRGTLTGIQRCLSTRQAVPSVLGNDVVPCVVSLEDCQLVRGVPSETVKLADVQRASYLTFGEIFNV